MDWYYLQMREMHALLAWVSVAFFLVRGFAFQLQAEWPMDVRVRTLVFGTDLLLTVCGLSLWGLMHFNPWYDAWLGTKLLALVAYTATAHWAMGRDEFSLLGYVLALLLLGYMMAVSFTRDPWLGL
ncbi:SirB2 family protein [Paucibacter sp. APW11]|uniref:SirB2 family protein n=1 Tax=Roseateles aquae TaxID=3077235 RepID=A0ABU3PB12_9BURK|nr:SirB2 family protein [Paucibacter sp. APW11]MDT8999420.1 SirB2 family protein [Paucibacter sp. APW11]